MSFALFSVTGLLFILRWLHFFFGVLWIGLLYYFNFVQGPFFNETDASTKSNATQKLVPRALWWFRHTAMGTMATGVLILMIRGHLDGMQIFETSWGVCILTGAAFGLTMWANVWFVIWPNQKIVIQSATQAAKGGQPLPAAAAAGAKGMLASRTNVLFSIPMLFFMGAASHLPIEVTETSNFQAVIVTVALILGALEFNALKGKLGYLTTVKGVITCGFVLAGALYFVLETFL